MRNKKHSAIAIILASTSAYAIAAAAEEDRRELDAHVHGHGSLNIAIEQGEVHMELEVPGADIVGFEYEPKSDEDVAAVEQAKGQLADPLALFILPAAADCAVKAAEVAYVTDDHDAGHDDHDDHHDEHADHDDHDEEHADHAEEHDDHDEEHAEHADEHHHDDDHDDHDEHAEEAGHAEFHGEYVLTCGSPDELSSIQFAYFDAFAGAEELEVGVITETSQASYEVGRDGPSIDLPASQ